jgi:hypothetical protein
VTDTVWVELIEVVVSVVLRVVVVVVVKQTY